MTQNFQQQTDEDLCSNPEPFDYGRCAGGCGKLPEECCYKSNVTMKMADFRCPGSDTIITKQVSKLSFAFPQWGAADAEIKVPSVENAELKGSPFKAWSR